MFEQLKDKQAARRVGKVEGKPKVKLYVDIISPFAHIAFFALEVRTFVYLRSSLSQTCCFFQYPGYDHPRSAWSVPGL